MQKFIKIWVEADDGKVFDLENPMVKAYMTAHPSASPDAAMKSACREYENLSSEDRATLSEGQSETA